MAGASTGGSIDGNVHYYSPQTLWEGRSTNLVASLGAFVVSLGFVLLVKQAFPGLNRFVNGLDKVLALFILTKKLFAYEEHSNAKAVPLDVFVVPVAGAYLLAVLDGIAAEGHSRAIAVAVVHLVFSQPLLYHLNYFLLREKFVGPTLHIFFRKGLGTLKRLVNGQFSLQSGFPLVNLRAVMKKKSGKPAHELISCLYYNLPCRIRVCISQDMFLNMLALTWRFSSRLGMASLTSGRVLFIATSTLRSPAVPHWHLIAK